jgi:hypothetical protein
MHTSAPQSGHDHAVIDYHDVADVGWYAYTVHSTPQEVGLNPIRIRADTKPRGGIRQYVC